MPPAGRGVVAFFGHVAEAEIEDVLPRLLGEMDHVLFHRKRRLRCAEAAEGAVRHRICQIDRAVRAHGRNGVDGRGTDEAALEHHA